jgi:hypothetical protein
MGFLLSGLRGVLGGSLLLLLVLPPPATVACSFFMCARGGEVLAGNNEDYLDPYTKMWFEPGVDGELGRVFFGFYNNFPQGGMNEAGLFFDGAALSRRELPAQSDKVSFDGNLITEAMRTCATVAEVIQLYRDYQAPGFMDRAQIQFADASGDSVILEGERILRKKGDYQITTNFRQADVKGGVPCPCWRYARVEEMLQDEAPTVELFTRILAAVHQEGKVSTLYSNVYDLKRGVIHIYHFHNFQEVVTLDLASELDKGAHSLLLHELFPATFAFQHFQSQYDAEQTASTERAER